jgi:hypothetical protein
VTLLLLVLSIGALLLTRDRVAAAVVMLGLLIVLAALSVPKSIDGLHSIYFQAGRIVLVAPMLLAFALYLAVHRGVRPKWPVLPVLAALVFATVVVRVVTFSSSIDKIEATALVEQSYPIVTVDEVRDRCSNVVAVAQATGARLAVFAGHKTTTYACAAMNEDEIDTLFPSYERRTWRLEEAGREPVTKFVIWDVTPDLCNGWRDITSSCAQVAPDAVLATFASQPALDVLNRMGFVIRPFGDGCHPRQLSTCTWFNQRWPQRAS